MMYQEIIKLAREAMIFNDRGNYTVPTQGLYPFQWNWDSCLSALGFNHFDEARAWTEINTLFAHQWEDGMVPHIIFHQQDDGYFPGPEVWNTGRKVPTTGITQPPVAGFAVRRLFERAIDKEAAKNNTLKLLPLIHKWHSWFFRYRDPHDTGLVAIIHPWESGRDNSIDWDEAFERVPTEGVQPFKRRDTEHADPGHRPTEEQYKRYIWLVQRFREMGWDNSRLHDESPFRIVDPGFNAILLRSCADIAALAKSLGLTEIADQSKAWVSRGLASMETLWSGAHGQYLCYDRSVDRLIDSASVGGLLPVFGPISQERAAKIAERIKEIEKVTHYLVPSHDPRAEGFDSRRYWRGPVWLIVNYMIADGLKNAGHFELADRIREDSVDLIKKSGFAEYYDPNTAEPCGGGKFTWTAAMVIEFLNFDKQAA